MKEYKRRKAIQNILEILEVAYIRTKEEDILNMGFEAIRFSKIE